MRRFLDELKNFWKKGDIVLLVLSLLVSAFGLIAIASATNAPKFDFNGLRYLIIQTAATLLGVIAVGALIGLVMGTLVMSIFGSAFNAVYLLPKFAQLYGIPLEAIIGMGSKIHPAVSNITTFVMLCVAPLNVVKGTVVSVLTMLLYKRVARPLFGIHR